MSKLRSVSTAFWSDPFIEELTPNQKLLFLYLITNEKTNMLGIYESSVKKISFETGINEKTVLSDLQFLESRNKIRYIKNYVVLVNFMKHQNFNTNMMKSAIDIYNNLPIELKDNNITISKDNPSEGFETLSNHFGMVRKVEVEVELETELETELNFNANLKPKIQVKKETPKKMLFRESEEFNFEIFCKNVREYSNGAYKNADMKFYYDSALSWSDSDNNKKSDWTATVGNWMLRDVRENKFRKSL